MGVRRVLVVGSGGREHALAWRLARDPGAPEVLVAPGNDGMARSVRRLETAEHDAAGLLDACRRERVDLVVIGPEASLAAGLADALEDAGHLVFGPRRDAARLESSKWHAKQVMQEAGVPTARAERHEGREAAVEALGRFSAPFVVKADGLAAGKGVCVCESRAEAEAFVNACIEGGRFGDSGRQVLIEEFLDGEEASVMAVCDGRRHVLLPGARDYKRAREGDRGPNTGGMGAFAPAPRVDESLEGEVGARIVEPVLRVLAARGTPYRGVLYCGLMLTAAGPRVVEFNCRFGDPETQVVLPLVDGSLAELLASAARGALEPSHIARPGGAAVAVALVNEGYPESASEGGTIENLEALAADPTVTVFHAGTFLREGRWRVGAGRAAYVMARTAGLAEARFRAYDAVDRLGGSGWRCRRDIAAGADRPRAAAHSSRGASARGG